MEALKCYWSQLRMRHSGRVPAIVTHGTVGTANPKLRRLQNFAMPHFPLRDVCFNIAWLCAQLVAWAVVVHTAQCTCLSWSQLHDDFSKRGTKSMSSESESPYHSPRICSRKGDKSREEIAQLMTLRSCTPMFWRCYFILHIIKHVRYILHA